MAATGENLHVTLHFGGGAEILFNGVKEEEINLPKDDQKWTIGRLIVWIKDNKLKSRQDLFVKGDTVRPGILVLVNDTDWDLLGQHEYELNENDHIFFISTLHGG